jgi:predicted NBD/HSP70 family sugar kinase
MWQGSPPYDGDVTLTSPPADGSGLTARALQVTRHLLVHGPASRAYLGSRLTLSEASMSRVARTLMRDGIVSETADPQSAIGRPRSLLSAVPSARHVVGVKLTGNRAYAVGCNMLGTVLTSAETSLPAVVDGQVPVHQAVTAIARLVRRLAKRLPTLDGVGIAVGGTVRNRAVVEDGVFLGWRNVDLAAPLADALAVPVVVSNDVTALAREQLWFGAGRTHSTFGVITVGAGLGIGVVREGHVVERLIDNGHLLTHTPIDSTGPPCSLGHHGCASAYLSRDEIESRMSAGGDRVPFARLWSDPNRVQSPWFVDAARALGHLVATFAGALQTERIVLAGEDVAPLVASPIMTETLAARLSDGPGHARCTIDISTDPLTFADWAQGAAVVSVQHVLGAL